MRNLLLIILSSFFVACSTIDDVPLCYNISANVDFSVINAQNEDLLNPSNPNRLPVSGIKIFFVVNGKNQEVSNPMLDNPSGFRIYKREDEAKYRIGVSLNHVETVEKPITYIQWSNADIDTLEASFERSPCGIAQQVIWLNGKKVWEARSSTSSPYFVKQM